MPTGRVKWFDPRQGFGYIIPDEGGPDVFVHHAEVRCDPPIDDGDRVAYDLKTSPKGPIALNVRPCHDNPPPPQPQKPPPVREQPANTPAVGQPLIVHLLRWTGRIVGTGFFLLLTAIALGEEGGLPNPWKQPWKVNLELHITLAVWLGFLIAWKWEGIGAFVLLAGPATFLILEGHAPRGLEWLLFLPGLAYLLCWMTERTARTGPGRPPP